MARQYYKIFKSNLEGRRCVNSACGKLSRNNEMVMDSEHGVHCVSCALEILKLDKVAVQEWKDAIDVAEKELRESVKTK